LIRKLHIVIVTSFAAVLLQAGCASMPASRLAKVGDAEMDYVLRGTTGPTAVFQSGLGDGKATWAGVLDRTGSAAAAFAYDRPGYGGSQWVSGPRDPCAIAGELRQLLRVAGTKPPYLLVGHSIGGLYQFAYAKLYPDEVAGLLLLDPTHPDHWAMMQQRAPASAAAVTVLRASVFTGPMRKEFDDQTACMDTLASRPPPSVPVRMIVRSRFELVEVGAFREMVRDLEKRWQVLLPQTVRLEAPDSGHYIQKDRPDLVAAELLRLHSLSSGLRR
jgi:pimeloyl-ACP methyl ester carboxylesterase